MEREGINVHQMMMTRPLTLATELLCIDPIPLVEVAIHPPEPPFVAAVKRCTNAAWNSVKRRWCVPLGEHSKLIQYLRTASSANGYQMKMDVIPNEVIRTVNRWKKKMIKNEGDSQKNALQQLPDKLRSSMYEFQKDGFYFAVKKEGRCLIADEMGLVCFGGVWRGNIR